MKRNGFGLRLLALVMIAGLGACAQGPEENATTGVSVPDVLEWEAVDGAVEYRVQLWSGLRLLFEEVRSRPALQMTPAMARSLRGASRVRMEVRALGPDGETVGEVQRQTFGAAEE